MSKIAATNMPTASAPTWAFLCEAEPRLTALLAEVREQQRSRRADRCHLRDWYGYSGDRLGYKQKLMELVGWERGRPCYGGVDRDQPMELRSIPISELLSQPERPELGHGPLFGAPAYDRAYATLYTHLLPCRKCEEGYGAQESAVRDLLYDRCDALGLRPRAEVSVACGRADIVTDDAVYECKLLLDRHSLLTAIGQVVLYASDLGRQKKYVVGYRSSDAVADIIAAARRAGIEVDAW